MLRSIGIKILGFIQWQRDREQRERVGTRRRESRHLDNGLLDAKREVLGEDAVGRGESAPRDG